MKTLNKENFHIIHSGNYNLIYHIESAQFYKCKKGSEIDIFFKSLFNKKRRKLTKKEQEIEEYLIENISQNDKDYPLEEWIENPISLNTIILPISGHCNLKCSYCFAQMESGFGFNDMTLDQIKKIVDFIINYNEKNAPCRINFFGGEPILKFDLLMDTIAYAKEKYNDREITFSLTTNGTIINKKIIDFLLQENISVLLSIDGPKDTSIHRKYKNGKNSFDTVFRNLKTLKHHKVKFQLRATISSDCEDMVRIYDFLESLEVPFFAVLAYKSANKSELTCYKNLEQKFESQYNALLKYYLTRFKSKQPIYCLSINQDVERIERKIKQAISCAGGRNLFAITDNGNIFTCEHFAFDSQYNVGNIVNGIDENLVSKMKPGSVNELMFCKECWARYLCTGGCFSSKFLTNRNNLSLIDDECMLKKIYWQFILRLYYELKTTLSEK